MIGRERYWVDFFAGCIVTKKDEFASPERYIEAEKNCNAIYVDTFKLGDNLFIDFAWTKEQQPYWQELLRGHFETHGVNWQTVKPKLIRRAFPPQVFDELLEV